MWEGADVDLGRLPIQTCWPGDAGPLITWGLTVTRGPQQAAPEPRHLSPAGDRAQPGHHALARASRRRARFPRPRLAHPGDAVSGRGRAGRGSGDHARRGHAGAGCALRVPVRGPAARRADRARRAASPHDLQVPASAEIVLEGTIHPSETALEGPVRRPHGLLQRAGALPGIHHRSDHDARATRSTTPPTPASRPTSRPCSASR